jgi:ribonuclease Z
MPLPERWLSSVIIRAKGQSALFDCGEGTQISLKILGWSFKDISAILISHFHADHVAGLVGMLLMIGNSFRREEVTVFGPPGLIKVLQGLLVIAPYLPFPLRTQELHGGETFEVAGLEGHCLMVDHGVPCLAYSTVVKRGRKFDAEKAKALGLPVDLWKSLQEEQSVEWQGRSYQPDDVLAGPRRGIKLSYVTDTRPTPELPGFLHGSDLLICEGMYGSPEEHDKAVEKEHLTFTEAAEIARLAKVKELWLTHFSPAMPEPEVYGNVARDVFPNSIVAHDRQCRIINFED